MPGGPGKIPLRSVRIAEPTWQAAQRRAAERGETVTDVIRRALDWPCPETVGLATKLAARDACRGRAAVAALARVQALVDSNPDHADTCGSVLTPGAGYPCSCWQADLRAALATTGQEGDQ